MDFLKGVSPISRARIVQASVTLVLGVTEVLVSNAKSVLAKLLLTENAIVRPIFDYVPAGFLKLFTLAATLR